VFILAFIVVNVASSSANGGRGHASTNTRHPHRIKSQHQLIKLLRTHHPRYYAGFRTGLTILRNVSAIPTAEGGDAASSSTLLQVAGVDEGDVVKNDAAYIYQINQGRVLVVHAFPDSNLGVVNTLDFSDGSFYPQELYLDGQHLVVVGSGFTTPDSSSAPDTTWYFSTSTVKALIYDIADPANLTKVREVEFQGDWVASRKIGSNLYLVARKYPEFYALLEADRPSTRAAARPKFRDTATGGTFTRLSISNCFYFPDFDDPNYLLIADIDVSDPNSQLDLNAYIGAGEQIYASTQNLYVTASRPGDIFFAAQLSLGAGPAVTEAPVNVPGAGLIATGTVVASPAVIALPYTEQTDIYKFSLNNGHTSFVATATVPGSILNQYSMDENNTYFRVATTQHGWWDATGQDNNNLLVLDANMSVVGSLTNVAAGEQIYAARFLGNRAFLVAFQQIDPLFAIDLSDPANPTIVGQLTLPGYSNFLLPYDENHLIGFGKDVIVAQGETDGDVPWWNGAAFYQGMKLALFDVTDLHNLVLLHSVSIGDRGTESPALYDPHSILFDRPSNLLAFPVAIAHV
jgi:inhibitor of cysteine peptidase